MKTRSQNIPPPNIVLVVEDHPGQRAAIVESLHHHYPQATLVEAASSEEARAEMDKLKQQGLSIDVAILDLMLPPKRGQETKDAVPDTKLPEEVRDKFPQAIRIQVSAYDQALAELAKGMEKHGSSLEQLAELGTYFQAKTPAWPRPLVDLVGKTLLNRWLSGWLSALDGEAELDSSSSIGSMHRRMGRRRDDTWPLRKALLTIEAQAHWPDLNLGLRHRLRDRLKLDADGNHQSTPIDTAVPPPASPENPGA